MAFSQGGREKAVREALHTEVEVLRVGPFLRRAILRVQRRESKGV